MFIAVRRGCSLDIPLSPSRLFNLKRHHWLHLVIPFVERAANAPRPLSVVAVNEATGRVDGVMIAEDWTAPRPLAYRSALSSEWVPVRALFSELHARYVSARGARPIFPREEVRCLYFTTVHPSARQQDVMKSLWRGTIDAAREGGFKVITAQASTDATRTVLNDTLGFSEVAAVPFDSWTIPPADAALAGCSPTLFADLATRKGGDGWGRLSIHKRAVPSNLY